MQIQEPLIEDIRKTIEDLSTPTTKGIAHCAARLGYTTNHQCFWVPHAENPSTENQVNIHAHFSGALPVNVSYEVIEFTCGFICSKED